MEQKTTKELLGEFTRNLMQADYAITSSLISKTAFEERGIEISSLDNEIGKKLGIWFSNDFSDCLYKVLPNTVGGRDVVIINNPYYRYDSKRFVMSANGNVKEITIANSIDMVKPLRERTTIIFNYKGDVESIYQRKYAKNPDGSCAEHSYYLEHLYLSVSTFMMRDYDGRVYLAHIDDVIEISEMICSLPLSSTYSSAETIKELEEITKIWKVLTLPEIYALEKAQNDPHDHNHPSLAGKMTIEKKYVNQHGRDNIISKFENMASIPNDIIIAANQYLIECLNKLREKGIDIESLPDEYTPVVLTHKNVENLTTKGYHIA